MKIRLYQVDAFTSKLFGGNPAAVCPSDSWLPDSTMQQIALENNLSETAFVVRKGRRYDIRWFTPAAEVALCGHATLASAHVLFRHLGYTGNTLFFDSKSGELRVTREDELLVLNFPADNACPVEAPADVVQAIGLMPAETYRGRTDYMFVYASEQDILSIKPDFRKLAGAGVRGIMVTAPGTSCDFVSRFFAPGVGIDEDPVTGSAHTTLIPYWAKLLGRNNMQAVQCSARRGYLCCRHLDDRVEIGGQAVTYLTGEIEIK